MCNAPQQDILQDAKLGFWSELSACASATKWTLNLALFLFLSSLRAFCSEQTWSLIG